MGFWVAATMHWLVSAFIGFGWAGLLLIAFADSSFLVIPIANDLLVAVLVAQNNARLPLYAIVAAAGSVAGALVLDIVFRKGGQRIERAVSRKRFDYLQRKMESRTGWFIGISALLPPPFPMKPAVVAAAVIQYPRRKMLAIVFLTRLVRYACVGLIGLFFSHQIVAFLESPIVAYVMYFLIAIAVLGSSLAVARWIRQSKEQPNGDPGSNGQPQP